MNIFEQYISCGLSVIPCDGKIPTISWKGYQTTIAGQEAGLWGGNVAIICGAVSGGVCCVDFDVKNGNKWDEWIMLINEQYPELLSKMVIEKTPSGGYHVVFRTDKKIKNIKLACNKEKKATIETRGEGGYFVCYPSENYEMYYGDFNKIQHVTDEDAETILSTAASFNEIKIEKSQPSCGLPESSGEAITPFNDYNKRCDIVGLLEYHGWTKLFQRGNAVYFQRPGKPGRGVSATWGAVPDRLYVFSTSTTFENNHIYKASAVYAILEHGGDYSAAAKSLFSKGYGVSSKKNHEQQEKKSVIYDTSPIITSLKKIYDKGYLRGTSTGWPGLDKLYSVVKGQFTVVTGMPSHGKSEFVDALIMNIAISDNWKFSVFSPENYPVEMHYHKLIEKYSGLPFLGAGRMEKNSIEKYVKFVNEHFFFIDALEEDITLELVLNAANELIETKKIDGLVIDPWNEIELCKPKDISSTEFIGKCLRQCRKFARRNNIHLWIVAHPTKMIKDKNGEYPVPELYDIEGSAHWRNKADNGICVFRVADESDEHTEINVQKIKYRYTGCIGKAILYYDQKSGRYYEKKENERSDDFFGN